jgi:nitroimidazol reductase NimA-like FMN-containing flavoprotein (pyridoxamine 5'-phosphate oxidase superfamily)
MSDEPSERTRLRRKADRGHYDRRTVYSIIDDGLVCHLGVTLDGHPTIIPATYGRLVDHLYVHGSQANRVLTALAQGVEACVEITVLDGVVLGRSPMRHSMNYRSVVIYGSFREAVHEREKLRAIEAILEHPRARGAWQARGLADPYDVGAGADTLSCLAVARLFGEDQGGSPNPGRQ